MKHYFFPKGISQTVIIIRVVIVLFFGCIAYYILSKDPIDKDWLKTPPRTPVVTPNTTTNGPKDPEGTVVKPDGAKVIPDGSVVRPDGIIILPDGTMVKP